MSSHRSRSSPPSLEPPPYIVASSTSPTEQINSNESLSLSISGTRIFSTAFPSRTLYSIAPQDILKFGGTGKPIRIEKLMYKMKDGSLSGDAVQQLLVGEAESASVNVEEELPSYNSLTVSDSERETNIRSPKAEDVSVQRPRSMLDVPISQSTQTKETVSPQPGSSGTGSSTAGPNAPIGPYRSMLDIPTHPPTSSTGLPTQPTSPSLTKLSSLESQDPTSTPRHRSLLDVPLLPQQPQSGPRLTFVRDEIYQIHTHYVVNPPYDTILIEGQRKRCFQTGILKQKPLHTSWEIQKGQGKMWDKGNGVDKEMWKLEVNGNVLDKVKGDREYGWVWKDEEGGVIAVENGWKGGKEKAVAPVLTFMKKTEEKEFDFIVAVWVAKLAWETKPWKKEPFSWEKFKRVIKKNEMPVGIQFY